MSYEAGGSSQLAENFSPRASSCVIGFRTPITSQFQNNPGGRLVPSPVLYATWGFLIVLTMVAFLLRASYLDTQSLWRDEVDVIRLANQPLPNSEASSIAYNNSDDGLYMIPMYKLLLPLVRRLGQVGYNGPLFYLLMRGWLRLAGTSEYALRYLSLCFGVLSVPLAFQSGRRLVGRRGALLAATLVVVSPYLVWYSQDAKMYALVLALSLLALTSLLDATARGQRRWWVLFLLFASLSLYAHVLAALMIPVYAVVFLLAGSHSPRKWRGALITFGLLTLPYLPLAIWQLPLVLDSYETGHPFYPIHRMLSLLLDLYARGVAPVGSWIAMTAFVFAILGGIFLTGDKRPRTYSESGGLLSAAGVRPPVFLVFWLLAPIVLVFLISLRSPVFEPRYLIFIAPAFYLLTALGVLSLSRISRTASILTLAVILSFSLFGVWAQATRPFKSDFRASANYILTHRQDEAPILFQMPYARYTFEYYFEADFVALEGPWTNDEVTPAQVEDIMTELLEPYSEIWLVASESWLWDSRDLTRAWLDQHAQLLESVSFTLVDVYRYQLPDLKSEAQGN